MSRDNSRDDMSFALRLANRKFSAEQILRELSVKPSGRRAPGSLKYQRILDDRGCDAANAYARRTAEKAIAFVKANPPILDRPTAVLSVWGIEGAADSLPWGTYGGAGPRRALEAVFVVAERTGGLKFGLALREWSELAGQSFEAIRAHRDRLIVLGWLRRNQDDRPGRTSRYVLCKPSHIHISHIHSQGDVGDVNVGHTQERPWLPHDAFREDGLGDRGWYVLLSCTTTPTPLHEIALRTGYGEDELSDIVRELEVAGLVTVGDDGTVCRIEDPARLDLVAEQRGTAGLGEADRKRHREERAAFRARGDVNVGEGSFPKSDSREQPDGFPGEPPPGFAGRTDRASVGHE